MRAFHLQIVTPSGSCFDGEVMEVTVPSIDGAVSILAGHIPYVTALGEGTCVLYPLNGEAKKADLSGGMISVTKECVPVTSSSFRWKLEK